MKDVDVLKLNHDLRNNTGVAISHLQLLVMEHPDLENDRGIVAAIESLHHSIKLLNDVSMQLKDSTEEFKPNPNLVSIRCDEHFINKAKPAYEKLRNIFPIEINDSYSLIEAEKYIKANQVAISSLRENIISNAIKSGATKIDISLEMKEYCLVVTYKDNGSGMSQEELDKIYLKQHGDGVIHGIGTKNILDTVGEGDGSYIHYASEINKGTTIRIVIPYSEP